MRCLFSSKLALVGLLLCMVGLCLSLACTGPAGVQGPPGPPAPSAGCSIVVMPTPVKSGESFTVAGSGFKGSGLVILTLVGVKFQTVEFAFGAAETNEYGAFSSKVTSQSLAVIKEICKPGAYTVKAEDEKGGIATAPLVIESGK